LGVRRNSRKAAGGFVEAICFRFGGLLDGRKAKESVVELIAKRLGEGRRGPKPFAQGTRLLMGFDDFLVELLQEIASKLDASFPLKVVVWTRFSYRGETGGVQVLRWRLFDERPKPSMSKRVLFRVSRQRRIRSSGDWVQLGDGRLGEGSIPKFEYDYDEDWRCSLFPVVGVLPKEGGGIHDEDDWEYWRAGYKRSLVGMGRSPTDRDVEDMIASQLLEHGGIPYHLSSVLAEMHKVALRARRRENMSSSQEYDDEHTGIGGALAWTEQLVEGEKEPDRAPLSVADVYHPRTPAECRAVTIALRAEALGFHLYGGRGRSISGYIRRVYGRRAAAVLGALSHCSRRHRKLGR